MFWPKIESKIRSTFNTGETVNGLFEGLNALEEHADINYIINSDVKNSEFTIPSRFNWREAKIGENIDYPYSTKPVTFKSKIINSNNELIGENKIVAYIVAKPVVTSNLFSIRSYDLKYEIMKISTKSCSLDNSTIEMIRSKMEFMN